MRDLPLTRIGRFEQAQLIGRGGMGSVYRVYDATLDRYLAIKLLRGDVTAEPEITERFAREARATARLNHPNIVSIYDVGNHEGHPYIAMEYVEGETLGQIIRAGRPLPIARRIEIIEQVCSGLAAAHRAGLVHRDIKPHNVMITRDGAVKILDFGIARFDNSGLTQSQAVLGTLNYMAPEQVRGDSVDHRVDIFSTGAVLYELLSGRQAFGGDIRSGVLNRILNGEVEPIETLVPTIDRPLADIVRRALAVEPELRYHDAKQMQEELSRVRTRLQTAQPESELTTDIVAVEPPADTVINTPPVVDGTMVGPVLSRDWSSDTSSEFRADVGTGAVDRPGELSIRGALPPGTKVGKFIVTDFVARGRTGHLYKAVDPGRTNPVGLKIIDNPSGVTVQRLLRASRIWLELQHPNLQRIIDVDSGDLPSRPALIVTQLIEGTDLRRLLLHRRLDLRQKIDIALQICDAVEYMHSRGVVHRELKPANVIVSQIGHGQVHVTLLDSGLARSTDDDVASLTVVGMPVGDFRYMAPEQASGHADERSDVFGLGVLLWEMILEESFDWQHRSAIRETLRHTETLPLALAQAICTALEEKPSERFGSVKELADSLRPLVPTPEAPLELSKIVVTLHGIRTHARWQRAFAESAWQAGLQCRLDRWNFGYFSLLRFMLPWSRQAKVAWFRTTYYLEFKDHASAPLSTERPSIVAHSFGTYILGNALMRYPYLRFNKVLLCGSILPQAFPWDALIERGQIQAVRNEYGARDFWTAVVRQFVHGTGRSGLVGFTRTHERLEQQMYDFSHSEYFEKGHMEANWIPFFKRRLSFRTPLDRSAPHPVSDRPYGLYMLYALASAVLVLLGFYILS